MGEIAWGTSNNFLLVAIPFFVLLGEILLRSGMAERMYNALVLWVPWLPGGLMHSNIAACAMFAATSGLERRHGGDDRHRGAGRGREARLFRAAVPRHDRGRRHARHPDPALDQHDRLRRAHRDLDPEALSRGLHPRHRSGEPVQPDGAGHLPDPAGAGRHADGDELGAAHRGAARPAAAADHLPRRDRLDLCRLGDGDRVGGARRDRRRRHRGLEPPAHAAHAAAMPSKARCAPPP